MSTAVHTAGPWKVGTPTEFLNQAGIEPAIGCAYGAGDEVKANARLIAAAPCLLAALTMGAELNTPDFLDWIAARLVNVHSENPNVDYVRSLHVRAAAARAAIARATGEQP